MSNKNFKLDTKNLLSLGLHFLVPDYYPCLIPPSFFTRYYNLTFSSLSIEFGAKHIIWDGIPVTTGRYGEPMVDVNIAGVDISMNADTGSSDYGTLSSRTFSRIMNGSLIKPTTTVKETRGKMTKTIAIYPLSATVGNEEYTIPFAVSVAGGDMANVLPIGWFIQHN